MSIVDYYLAAISILGLIGVILFFVLIIVDLSEAIGEKLAKFIKKIKL